MRCLHTLQWPLGKAVELHVSAGLRMLELLVASARGCIVLLITLSYMQTADYSYHKHFGFS